ncbi:MAG TPA: hypothetical protein PLS71_22990 [Leptospiraceae bacterium]|nr:hypothetical protein [Leptospiraceae bacterium]HNC01129.1 hypothetical protein [Leptospiraceae bacterium]HNE10804.1 hypothetical protein [Leptospiraceae bacterium]HNH01894.1 hypothetical protein [Leptospiraceae bacterium]HNI90812.1 hypothetical protein [Leptospiraceae bacterium]
MMGRQINFYLMNEDFVEIDEYISMKGLIVIPNYTKTEGLELVNSILDKNYYAQKFLSLTTLSDQIIKRFIETQKYFTVDILNSPVIEFSLGYQEENLKRRGRVYYTKNKIGNGSPKKNELFLQMADDFFKWIRKNFKNVKLKGYEEFLISERTMQWLNESNDRKLGDFPEVLKQDIENRKLRVA